MRFRITSISNLVIGTLLVLSMGCGTTPDSSDRETGMVRGSLTTTVDGLVRVESDAPGDLYLREDHGIGGYDSIVIAPAFVTYRRRSTKLDPELENIYLVSLEQALLDEAESLGVEMVDLPGPCVIKVGIGFIHVNLAASSSVDVIGEMTMVIEYQDSVSGESLLRYTAKHHIDREPDGMSRDEQLRRSFDAMIDSVDMNTALRKATIVPSKPREGCSGNLLKAGPSKAAS